MKKSSTPNLDTKSLIVLKSLPHFVKYGANGLTLSDISRAVGVSKPSILYHYKSPQEIFLALMEQWALSGTQFTNAYLGNYIGQGPDTIIVGVMEATLAWLDTDEPFAQLSLAVFLAAQGDKIIQHKLDNLFSGGRDRIASLLKLSRKKMKITEAEELALHIHTQIVGSLIYEMLLNEKRHDKKKYRASEITRFKKIISEYF